MKINMFVLGGYWSSSWLRQPSIKRLLTTEKYPRNELIQNMLTYIHLDHIVKGWNSFQLKFWLIIFSQLEIWKMKQIYIFCPRILGICTPIFFGIWAMWFYISLLLDIIHENMENQWQSKSYIWVFWKHLKINIHMISLCFALF